MKLTLPYPPSINRYWRQVRQGKYPRTYISKHGKDYRAAVEAYCLAERVQTLAGPVALVIDAYPPDRRRRDIDNLLKPLLDALEAGEVFEDDSQVKRLRIQMHEPRKGGELVVSAEVIPEEQA